MTTPRTQSDYIHVTGMFRRLAAMEENSAAYHRQRDAIVATCLPLADHIARRFSNRGESVDDLVQVARVGLIQAVNRYDVSTGAEFLAFAVPTMMGEVRRHFRDHGWSFEGPAQAQRAGGQLNRSRDKLAQQLGRAPTAGEIAADPGIDREEIQQAMTAFSCYSTLSFDAQESERV